MNTKRTIYEKINLINPKVELSQVEVELATIYDDLKGTLANANQSFFKALDLRGQSSKLCRDSITKNEAILKELNKAESLIKELGLDSELKKVLNAKSEVLKNIDLIDKALNNFLSI